MLPTVSVVAARTYCTTAPFVAGLVLTPSLSRSSSRAHASWQEPVVVVLLAWQVAPKMTRVSPPVVPLPVRVTVLAGSAPASSLMPNWHPLDVRYSAVA